MTAARRSAEEFDLMIASPLHEACVLLLPLRESASGARTFLAGHLAEWGADDDALEVAVLLVSELVTNAIVHAGTAAEVSVAMDDSIVRVGVTDTNPTGVQVRPYARMATSGRGLRIVDSLAERWGVDAGDRTKTIWFELAAPHRGTDTATANSRQVAVSTVSSSRSPVISSTRSVDGRGARNTNSLPAVSA